MKKKQMVAALMTAMLLISAVGCSNSQTGNEGGGGQTGTQQGGGTTNQTDNAAAGSGDAAESVVKDDTLDHSLPYYRTYEGAEFTTIIQASGEDLPEGQTLDDNDMLTQFTAVTGATAKIDWCATGDAYREKQNACISTGDIPDLMQVSFQQYQKLVKADLIADMTDYIEEYTSPDLKSVYAMSNNLALDSLKVDGRIYGIPKTTGYGDGTPIFWIRKDWLDKLNLDEPTCIKDIEKIALAFMEQDPDGNGEKDTYGMPIWSSYDATGSGNLGNIFLNVGGAAPGCWMIQDDGTVIRGDLMEGAKEALTLLNDWYNKGIIPVDYATWDSMSAGITNDKIGICLGPWWYTYGEIGNSINANPDADWQPYILPYDKNDPVYLQGGSAINGIYVVRKDYADPAMFVVLNNLVYSTTYDKLEDSNCPTSYSPILSSQSYTTMLAYGKGFDVWEKGEISTVEEYAQVLRDEKMSGHDIAVVLTALPSILPCMEAETRQEGEANGGSYVEYLGRCKALEVMYRSNPVFVSTQYLGSTDAEGKYGTFLQDYRNEAYTKMIMGDTDGKSISEYFDEFVESYLAQGGSEIRDEVQAQIDAR